MYGMASVQFLKQQFSNIILRIFKEITFYSKIAHLQIYKIKV